MLRIPVNPAQLLHMHRGDAFHSDMLRIQPAVNSLHAVCRTYKNALLILTLPVRDCALACAGNLAKRRRTEGEATAELAARNEKRTAKEAALAAQREAAAGGGAFRLKAVQPWADKEGKQEELTEEQKEYLAKVEADKKEKEAAKEKTESVRPFHNSLVKITCSLESFISVACTRPLLAIVL